MQTVATMHSCTNRVQILRKPRVATTVRAVATPQRSPAKQQKAQQDTVMPQALPVTVLTALMQLQAPLAMAADEPETTSNFVEAYFSQLANLSPAGIALLSSPLILYGGFRVYQSNVNPNAKWGDVVFLFAFVLIVANIVSIAAYKVRLF